MSATGTGASEPPPGGESSMEDILTSIRRILSDGEQAPGSPDVLMLDPSMVIAQEKPLTSVTPAPVSAPPDLEAAATAPVSPPVSPPASLPVEDAGLLGPEATAAAASTLGSLMRKLASDRSTPVHRGGPTIEDLVREEIRPLLKAWLDAHLPELVERVVQSEIERLMHRAPPLI